MTPYRHLHVVRPIPPVNPNLYDATGSPRGPLCHGCETPILPFETVLCAYGEITDEDFSEWLLAEKFCLPCRVEQPLVQKAVGK